MRNWISQTLVLALALVGVVVIAPTPANATPTQETVASSVGTEFYVTFNYGFQSGYDRIIYLSAAQSGTATIYWPSGSETYTLTANSTTSVDATNKAVTSTGSPAESTALISARITSTVPISVYGLMLLGPAQGGLSAEAFTAIPTTSLGTTYRILGQPSVNRFRSSEFSVVATEDGTTVSITPSAALGSSRTANVAYTVNLSRGQVYTALVPSSSNMSGTLVTSNKKVVVTSASQCADLTWVTCDHLIEYMPPIDSWGSSFLLPGSLNRAPSSYVGSYSGDIYEILAHQDGTAVTINGSVVSTLNAGQTYRHAGTGVSGVQRVDTVQTSKPALVGHFLLNGLYGPDDLSGDPSFSLVTPTLQFLRQYNVATPATGFRLHSLTLITLTNSASSVLLNETQIPGSYGTFTPIAGSDYSIARLQIPAGSYSISGSTGIGVYGSGFDTDISYAYPAGFGLLNLIENPGGVESLPAGSSNNPQPSSQTSGAPQLAATGGSAGYSIWIAFASLSLGIAIFSAVKRLKQKKLT